jgi:hypothetical protein
MQLLQTGVIAIIDMVDKVGVRNADAEGARLSAYLAKSAYI